MYYFVMKVPTYIQHFYCNIIIEISRSVVNLMQQIPEPNLSGNGLDWLCYLAGNSQTAPRICFFKDFIKNPQTTIALTFLTHIISDIDGVKYSMIPKVSD